MPETSPSSDLERGRAAYERRDWNEAHAALGRAATGAQLEPDDLWLLAVAAYLTGQDGDFVEALEQAHHIARERAEAGTAARAAFWIGFHLAERGDMAQATGWFGRMRRLLESSDEEHVEQGYLLLPAAQQRLGAGDADGALELGRQAAALGQRFGDRDLLTLAVHAQGRALLLAGQVEDGLALLDEAMVAAATDELSPPVTGLLYCSVISACRSVYDLGRAREWTAALADWCERQPDMVAYAGECRVYRAELMQLRGAWDESLDEARRAGERAQPGAGPVAGLAAYQQGEVHRLRGDLEAAEEAYRSASRAGREPQPGLALLRLAQGEPEAAASASRRALAEAHGPLRRARLLPAHVEIMIAADRLDEAREGCAELERIAGELGTGVLDILSTHARGAVALAEGDAGRALPLLRRAWRRWHELNAPHDAARARLLLGLACRALGDEDGAAMEMGAARSAFERLGAAPDVERVDRLTRPPERRASHGLTPREREVLALVARGMTNRAVADKLFISDRTVARHVSNIFGKLGVSSRAAATAWAYEHGLTGPTA